MEWTSMPYAVDSGKESEAKLGSGELTHKSYKTLRTHVRMRQCTVHRARQGKARQGGEARRGSGRARARAAGDINGTGI